MKNYLVAYDVGYGFIKATQIQVNDGYVPTSDNMILLKNKIIEKDAPRWREYHTAPDNCGSYLKYTTQDKISIDKLQIVAVSNLDL